MIPTLLFFHILAAVVWVGGMFFAHQMVRPSVGPLDAPVQARAVAPHLRALLRLGLGGRRAAAGHRHRHGDIGRRRACYVTIMEALGVIMMLAFAHLFFAPWKRFRRAVDASDFPAAAAQLNQIRRIVEFNLALGLIVVVVGATGRYWG